MPEMKKEKEKTLLVSEISCVIDQLPNVVMVHLRLEKNESLSTTGRKTLWFNSMWMYPLSKLLQSKTIFPLEIVFYGELRMVTMVEGFNARCSIFWFTSNV